MTNRRGALIPGAILILLGAWFLAQNLGIRLPGLDQLWPLFPLLFGLGFLAQYFGGGRRDDGLVFTGVAAALVGAFFLAITLGPLEWNDMGRYWPVFVLIGGLAFLAQYAVKPTDRGLLFPAVIALLFGLVALVFTLGSLNRALADQLLKLWPVVLIALGLALLASYVLRRNRPG